MAFWQSHDNYADNDPEYTECHFRFAGQYEDKENGLYYNRFRYYDKDTGQYISPDPIGLLGGFNPYGYVHCPTGWVDPFGLTPCPPPKIRGTQTGFRKPGQIDGIKRAMLDGSFDFKDIKKRIGGYLDSKGTYHVTEGHHRMAAAQEIYKETGNSQYITQLLNEGRWTKQDLPLLESKPMPSRSFLGSLRNKLGF